jgi:hypothetical protein
VVSLSSIAHIHPDPTLPPPVKVVAPSSSSSSSAVTPAETAETLVKDISVKRTEAGLAMPEEAELAKFKAFIVACIEKKSDDTEAVDVTEVSFNQSELKWGDFKALASLGIAKR